MEYVSLGDTGVKVSRLCLGMMTYGSPAWRDWVLPEAEGCRFVRQALDHGINFFDTADMYSRGASEENPRAGDQAVCVSCSGGGSHESVLSYG